MANKYTKESLSPIVAQSQSMNEVMRNLGLGTGGGGTSYISKLITKFEIDRSHFVRSKPKGSPPNRKTWQEFLIIDREREHPPHADVLRRSLIESGREYVCEFGHLPIWNGADLTLQVDHMNGDRYDNRPENLQFLCPNCHTQTHNWGARNRR